MTITKPSLAPEPLLRHPPLRLAPVPAPAPPLPRHQLPTRSSPRADRLACSAACASAKKLKLRNMTWGTAEERTAEEPSK